MASYFRLTKIYVNFSNKFSSLESGKNFFPYDATTPYMSVNEIILFFYKALSNEALAVNLAMCTIYVIYL